MDVEEFGGAAVEANALTLVELALAVVGGDTLCLADLVQTIVAVALVMDQTGRRKRRTEVCVCGAHTGSACQR